MLLKISQYETKIIQLKEECKVKEAREHNLHEVIASFTHSYKIMDKMVYMQKPPENKTRLGFDSISSPAHNNLTKQTGPLINKGANVVKFVKSQEHGSRPRLGFNNSINVRKDNHPKRSKI